MVSNIRVCVWLGEGGGCMCGQQRPSGGGGGAGCETTVKQSTKGNNLIRSKKLDEISVYVIGKVG